MSGRRPDRVVGRRTAEVFDPAAANAEMADKLGRNALQRRARKQGLELRHSSYGYALITSARERVDGRNDLTLREVAARLNAEGA